MAIEFSCSECDKSLRVKDDLAGKRVRCPGCQTVMKVPEPRRLEDELADEDASDHELATSEDAGTSPNLEDDFPDLSEFERPKPRRQSGSPRPAATRRTDGEPPPTRTRSVRAPADDDGDMYIYRPAAPVKPKPAKTEDEETPAPRFQLPKLGLHSTVLLLFIPLALHAVWPAESMEKRLEKTFPNQPELVKELQEGNLDDVFGELPENGKIAGAHLPHNSRVHWIYAFIAMVAYWGLIAVCWPESTAGPYRLLFTGLFTGTVGIGLLLAFQVAAMITGAGGGMFFRGPAFLIFLVLKLIAFSYYCALDPNTGLILSFVGFTVGVGLCEEFCKAIPVVWYLRSGDRVNWQGACLMGLASGIGFGVSEGVHYAGSFYNGIAPEMVYVVRFLSCVALHAVWSSGVALLMYANQDWLDELWSWTGSFFFIVNYLLVAMVLHGLYDTLLKKELGVLALAVAFGSYGWWVWLMKTFGPRRVRRRTAST